MPLDEDILSEMEEDAKAQFVAPRNEDLAEIASLATEQINFEAKIARLTEELEEAKKGLSLVSEVKIPNALERFGMVKFMLIDGSMIEIKKNVVCGISKENEAAAFAWLTETGNDGIIKNEFKIPLGKGQEEDAKQLRALLDEKGYTFVNSRGVHHSTLKAFVKKRLEAGEEIPMDVFSVFEKKTATVIPPSKRK